MSTSTTAASAHLLTQVAGERQTGALVVGGHPGGAVYVLEGQVIYAESPAAPGVGELLTSSGRLANRTWQNALDLGTSTARVGRLLVEQGHLTQGELELCVLGATYDAAYFALAPTAAPVEFLAGATHWLGAVVHIDPAAVDREVRRRARLLDEIFPDPRVDTAAVTPVARPPRERVTLTALQWELLIHADGQRTPADLALLLGKAGYATIQELRRLAAAGLLDLPDVRGDAPEFLRLPRARGTAADARRPAVRPDDAPTVPVLAGVRTAVPGPPQSLADSRPSPAAGRFPAGHSASVSGHSPSGSGHSAAGHSPSGSRHSAAGHSPSGSGHSAAGHSAAGDGVHPPVDSRPSRGESHPPAEEGGVNGTVYRPPRLARRKPGAKLPKEVAGETPPTHLGTDEVLLKRIRTALRALR